ncbi:MAG TPA: hypothetical protein VN634_06305 [Candidatus Limnocylindrales bacterium]|nr:hypothetical protein [Candidatus Limnocylindrales bacterium]
MIAGSAVTVFVEDLIAEPRGRTALRLTAVFLLATSHVLFAWHPASVFAAALGVMMLLSPRLLESRWTWAGVFAVLVWGLVTRWPVTENNRYLDAYWVLACCLASGLTADECDRVLARNGRLLIGLTFTLAATQKALRGGYFDGSFMHGLVLWDERFRSVASLLGGLDAKDLAINSQLKSALGFMPWAVESVSFVTSERLRLGTFVLGYLVLLLEASVGLSFLLPGPRWLTRWRHYLLFLFVLPTYLLAQVSHFGLILTIMGFAQCPTEQRRLRLAYLLVFVFVCFADMTAPMLIAATVGA